MNSSESSTANGELILKTEEYDFDGPSSIQPQPPHLSLPLPPTAFIKSNSCTNRLVSVNFNNNLTINCNQSHSHHNNNSNSSLSPKLESYCPPSSSSSPSDNRMPIPTVAEMQSTAGTTPAQHSMSPSLPPLQQQTSSSSSSSSQQQHSASSAIPNGGCSPSEQLLTTRRMTSILGGYGLVSPGLLGPLDHYRLQLYSYAMNVERLRGCGAPQQYPGPLYSSGYPGSPGGPVGNGPYAPTRFALSMGLFPNRMFQPEEPKPQHSYIGLIAMAILSSPDSKLVLSDIYQHILDNYPYFRTRGPGWRNSIRHNLSLNDCFIKAGRSANGKGHYWAIHPANMDDFRKGDFRRRKAQRKVRKHMGLAVDDEGTDSPSPPPLAVTPPPMAPPPHHPGVLLVGSPYANPHHPNHQHYHNPLIIGSGGGSITNDTSTTTTTAAGVIANLYSQTRKRQFDVASLLAPDETPADNNHHHHQQSAYKGHHLPLISKQRIALTEDEDIDVVASDVDDDHDQHILRVDEEQFHLRSQQQHHQQHDLTANNNSLSFTPPPESNSRHQHHYQSSSSPTSQHESSTDLPPPNNGNLNPTATAAAANWQGLMQHWPNEFGTAAAAAAAAAMDPRIFGRYYSQYMAAAAARRVAGVFPAAAAAAAAAAVIGHQNQTSKQQQSATQHSSLQQKQQHQQSYEC